MASDGSEGVGPPPSGSFRWIDLQRQEETELAVLQERFGFHPLAIEDCAHFNQRPKLEEYGDHLFLVTQACGPLDAHGEPELQELHAFLGQGYLVTVHDAPLPALDAVWKRVAGDPVLVRRGLDFVYYLVVDHVIDTQFPIVDGISDGVDKVEESAFEQPEPEDLERIFHLKNALGIMRKVLVPQRDVFAVLARRDDPRVSSRTALYFRDVYDHVVRLIEAIETSRELLANARDAYLSVVSNRTNEVMKRLTVLSAIFLPLTFVTGFFGQNFEHLPFDSDALMYVMIAACLALPTGMLWWFRRSRWI